MSHLLCKWWAILNDRLLMLLKLGVFRCYLRRPYIQPKALPNSSVHYSSSFLKCAGDPVGTAVKGPGYLDQARIRGLDTVRISSIPICESKVSGVYRPQTACANQLTEIVFLGLLKCQRLEPDK